MGDAATLTSFDLFLNDLPDLRPTTSSTTGSAMLWDDFEQDALNGGVTINSNNDNTKMAIGGTTDSSPADFAFEAPLDKTPFQYNPTTNNTYYGSYSTGNSFSSASSGGASFSSADALPAISRDFARPSPVDTRRPATAGGALGMRSPQVLRRDNGPIEEEMFTNPFGAADSRPMNPDTVDPRHVPAHRRASDGFSMAPPSTAWPQEMPSQYTYNPMYRASAPSATVTRPVTSDGLPSFGGIPALPSARSVIGSVDGFTPLSGLQPAAHIRSSFDDGLPFRDARVERFPGAPRTEDYTSQQSSQKKRPRRRYDEIERMYLCGWNGCEKSYGTLNHLNAHVAMQKHGEKRLPSEFKDLRKAFRKRKREQAAAMANANASAQYVAWTRGSVSSESDYSRRDSFASAPRYSVDAGMYDSRPNTAGSTVSSVSSGYGHSISNGPSSGASAASLHYDYPQAQLQQQQANAGMINVRRDSAPQHIPLPSQPMGFRAALDGPTPTQQNPFPTSSASMPALNVHTNRQQAPPGAAGGFPFQALTQPMPGPGQMVQGYQQFAFQR